MWTTAALRQFPRKYAQIEGKRPRDKLIVPAQRATERESNLFRKDFTSWPTDPCRVQRIIQGGHGGVYLLSMNPVFSVLGY